MLALSRDPVTTMLSERLLITRIITALGVALMLVIGVWSAAHAEADRASESASATVAEAVSASKGAASASDHPTVVDDTAGASAPDEPQTLLGLAACLLGVVCGIVLLSLLRRFGVHAGAGSIRRRPSPVTRIVARARAFVPAPTLAQLALSRT